MAISLLVLPAFWSGEPAEDGIEHLPGVSKHLIHEHEEAAEKALTLGLITGAIGLIGLVASRKKDSVLKIAVNSALVGSIITSIAMAKTAHEGGKIRHPEIIDGQIHATNGNGTQEKDHRSDRNGDRDGDHDNGNDRDRDND
jgi:delta-aminolevulinic acid dehydratase/porphobilinogen synthase